MALTAIAACSIGTANAGVFFYRTAVVTPVVVAPVVVAPVVSVPTCRLVAMPVVNVYTGWTYMVARRVCN